MQRILILLLTVNFVFITTVHADEATPKIAEIKKGQRAPYDGILYNYEADAQMSASRESTELECELSIKHAKNREKTRCDLAVNSAVVSLDATKNKYESLMKIKDQEINRLTKIATENGGNYRELVYIGGVVSGVALSVLIFYAAVKIQK